MDKSDAMQLLMGRGLSYEAAAIVADLADHAGSEALEALVRVVNTAPAQLRHTTLLLSLMVMQSYVAATVNEMREKP